MLSVQKSKWLIRLLIPVLLAIVSLFILSEKIPETKFVQTSLESVEKSKTTVMEFAGATLATSLAISALPDDFATPLADSLADMNKYFVFILMVLFVERLILMKGIAISFRIIIPIGCVLYAIGYGIKKEFFVNIGKKIALLGLALVLVIPCSTHFTNYVCADYLAYVDETIADTKEGSDTINEAVSGEDSEQTMFEKLSGAFKTAMQGVKDLLNYFHNMIKKCINSIAIMIVTTFVLPLVNLFFFKWLLGELFQIRFAAPDFTKYLKKKDERNTAIEHKQKTNED
ncbi:MAG: hypothetical protein PUD20_04955 [bacterium]|nr:hypothetical protein [bacterium]